MSSTFLNKRFVIVLLTFVVTLATSARADRAFAPRFSVNTGGDITLIGNTVLTASSDTSKAAYASQYAAAQNGTATPADANINDEQFMDYVDVDGDGTTFDSSSATLSLPSGASVLFAGLYWGAQTDAGPARGIMPQAGAVVAGAVAPNAAARSQVLFSTPSSGYTTIAATTTDQSAYVGESTRYSCFSDVTAMVQSAGNGVYTIGNVQAGTGSNGYGGWTLVVVYKHTGDPPRNLVVYDGFARVYTGNPTSINLSGFNTPLTGAVNVQLGVVAYEGDIAITGDTLLFNGSQVSDALNPADNFFNSSITLLGTRFSAKNPDYVNQLGLDADIVQLSNPSNSVLANGATSATLSLTSTGDLYYPAMVTTAIDLYTPTISATKTFTDLNGGNVTPGDILEYTITIANTAGDVASNGVLIDPIPAQMTYVPGTIQISAGANSGAKTDAAGDDQAEFDAANNRVVVRLGTGANATTGGQLAVGASATVKFRAQVKAGVTDGTQITNQATYSYQSLASGVAFAASTNSASVQNSKKLSGTVFEDVNYGGGAGRDLATSSGAPRSGARVELYDGAGNFVSATTTDATGRYTFVDTPAGAHTVRVVSSTVTSSRMSAAAGLLPVMTFANGDVNRVGGEDPSRADAGNGATTLAALSTATNVAQSLSTFNVPISDDLNVDFGFNFDTVVNTNDSGQGSLRQFILNANALSNSGLAQSGLTAGKETSIFMISDGAAHAGLRAGLTNQLTSGVAVITQVSALPAITDANTNIDGTTQTTNIGDTNANALGTGGTVGVDALSLPTVNAPEIQITGANSIPIGLDVQAANTTISGIAIYGFGNTPNANNSANIRIGAVSGATIKQNVIGASATAFTDPGASARTGADNIRSVGATNDTLQNNLVGFAAGKGFGIASNSSGWTVTGNEFRGNAIGNTSLENLDVNASGNCTITGNLCADSGGPGFDTFNSTGGNIFQNNTVTNNGQGGALADAGIRIFGASNTVSKNIINSNGGSGVQITANAGTTTISQNSIFQNGAIGIDLQSASDNINVGTAPYVTPNDPGDTDTGGNGLLNFPIISSAVISGGNLVLSGFAEPGAVIELFVADPDASGFGEGKTYLLTLTEGSAQDTDNTTGTYTNPVNGLNQGTDTTNRYTFTIPIPNGVAIGTKITATATLANATSEFCGNTTVTAPGVAVSGTVYLDANHNLVKDSNETGSGLTLYAKIVPTSSPSGPAVQAVAVNPATGAYAFSSIAAGTYNVLIDGNNTLSDVTPTLPSGWSFTQNSTGKTIPLAVTAQPLSGVDFGVINALALSGNVFSDNGAGTGGVANDGVKNGSESGLAGVSVKLTDATGGTIYDSATTNSNGDYVLLVPQNLAAGTTLKVLETNAANFFSTGGNAGTTGGTYDRTSDAVTFSFSQNVSYTGVNFADAPGIVFNTDGAQANLPGTTVIYPHTFIAGSAGQVTFSTSAANTPSLNGWTATLYRDTNGNGVIDSGDPILSGPISVTAGQTISVLVKVFIPANAPFNAIDKLTVTANFVYTNANPSLSNVVTRSDITTVGNPVTAGLTLTKSVDKTTARPGDTITYTITYANNSSSPLSNVTIYDNTPAFTTFTSASNGALPATLSGVALSAPAAGASGAIRWTFTGQLAPAGTGTVTFRVNVAQ